MVAVKQIDIGRASSSVVDTVMMEIDLLKNLNHPNIVKYHGFVKTQEKLSIILELCENGSLRDMAKNFGNLPEGLVVVYMKQVLEGLHYLHSQGTIHRDIKGANILATKTGSVKLADFGVATKLVAQNDSEGGVAGTPNFMAPEIIELNGASPASDIWSLGCTIIELMTGSPPYAHLDQMAALFAIVDDECPKLPDAISPGLRDFLLQCFRKDPNLRPSAERLLRHPWIIGTKGSVKERAKRTVKDVPQETVKEMANENGQRPRAKQKSIAANGKNLSKSAAMLLKYSEDGDDGFLSEEEQKHLVRKTVASTPENPKKDAKNIVKSSVDKYREDGRDDFSDLIGDINPRLVKTWRRAPAQKLPSTLQDDVGDDEPLGPVKQVNLAQFAEEGESADISMDIEDTGALERSFGDLSMKHGREATQEGWDDADPFASFEASYDSTELKARGILAAKQSELEDLVKKLSPKLSEQELASLSGRIVGTLRDYPDTAKAIVATQGWLTVLEILEKTTNGDRTLDRDLLEIMRITVSTHPDVVRNLCVVDGLRTLGKFVSKRYAREYRHEVSLVCESICGTDDGVALFATSGSMPILAQLLDDDFAANRELVLRGVGCLWRVFEYFGISSERNVVCRRLSRDGLHDVLVQTLLSLAWADEGPNSDARAGADQVAKVLLCFSQADTHVKELVATRPVFRGLLRCYPRLSQAAQLTVLKFLRNTAAIEANLGAMQNANVIEDLTRLLDDAKRREPPQRFKEVSTQVIPILYSLCRLSPARQEEAAVAGAVPLLQDIAVGATPLRQFALPILCEMASHGGSKCHAELWRASGLDTFLSLVADPYWQSNAFDAIAGWQRSEAARVESVLITSTSRAKLVSGLEAAKSNTINMVLEAFTRMLALSRALSRAVSPTKILTIVRARLTSADAVTSINLLRLVRTLMEHNPRVYARLEETGFRTVLKSMARSTSTPVMVRQLAIEIVKLSHTPKPRH